MAGTMSAEEENHHIITFRFGKSLVHGSFHIFHGGILVCEASHISMPVSDIDFLYGQGIISTDPEIPKAS